MQVTIEIVGGERGVVTSRQITISKPTDLQLGVDDVVREFRTANPGASLFGREDGESFWLRFS